MPNIKSAIKRVKVTDKKNLRNRMIKSQVKTAIKKLVGVDEKGKVIEKNVNIKDIAPTIANLLGATPDEDWEGKVIE